MPKRCGPLWTRVLERHEVAAHAARDAQRGAASGRRSRISRSRCSPRSAGNRRRHARARARRFRATPRVRRLRPRGRRHAAGRAGPAARPGVRAGHHAAPHRRRRLVAGRARPGTRAPLHGFRPRPARRAAAAAAAVFGLCRMAARRPERRGAGTTSSPTGATAGRIAAARASDRPAASCAAELSRGQGALRGPGGTCHVAQGRSRARATRRSTWRCWPRSRSCCMRYMRARRTSRSARRSPGATGPRSKASSASSSTRWSCAVISPATRRSRNC